MKKTIAMHEQYRKVLEQFYPTTHIDVMAEMLNLEQSQIHRMAFKCKIKKAAGFKRSKKPRVPAKTKKYADLSKQCSEFVELFEVHVTALRDSGYASLATIPETILTECYKTDKLPKLEYLKRHVVIN